MRIEISLGLAILALASGCTAKPAEERYDPAKPAAAAATPQSAFTPPAEATLTAKHYDCDKYLIVLADYRDNDTARLVIEGKAYEAKIVMSASGAKYQAATGRAPGKSLVWWTKGDDAMLIEGQAGVDDPDRETIINCHEAKDAAGS